jgi:hypothetical protein
MLQKISYKDQKNLLGFWEMKLKDGKIVLK